MADPDTTAAPAPAASAPVETAPAAAPTPQVAEAPAGAAPSSAEPSFADVLAYDPFKGRDRWVDDPVPAPGATPGVVVGAPAPAIPTPSGAGVTPPPQAPAPAPSVDPVKFAALLESNQKLERDLAEMRGRMSATPPAAPAPPTPPADDGLAAQYQANIPAPIIEALASDQVSVRQQALGALLQGIGVAVHRNIRKEMQTAQQALLRDLPRHVQGHVGSTLVESEVKRDFFGKYPQFAAKELAPLVQQVTMEVVNANKATGWSAELRDAIGGALTQRLATLMGMPVGVVPNAQPAPPVAPARQPFAPSGGAPPRPAASGTPDPNAPASIGSVW